MPMYIKELTCRFIVLFFVTFSHLSLAQPGNCGTKLTTRQANYLNKGVRLFTQTKGKLRTSGTTIYVPVKAHIIRKNDESGGLEIATLSEAINKANEHYQNADIQFYLYESIHYINNSIYYNLRKDDDNIFGPGYDIPNVINIYFTNTIIDQSGEPLCGYAYFPGDNKDRVIVGNSCVANGSTLSHELGHFFSLYHTHETYEGKELADGSNCATTGDRICDTPADPGLSKVVNESCIYTGVQTDSNGQAYTPDTHNIMSYAPSACRNRFSQGQHELMMATLLSEHSHLFTKLTPTPVISSFSPANAAGGTQITIQGTGFSPVATENIVRFGNLSAKVVASTNTNLTVIVPYNVSESEITVVRDQQMVIGQGSFWTEVVDVFPYAEGFESDLGHWQQSTEDDANWLVKSGASAIRETVPGGAGEGAMYLYAEALPGEESEVSKRAILNSKSFNLSVLPNPQFLFSYHLQGVNSGILRLEVSQDNAATWDVLWTKTGDHGNSWHPAVVNLSAYQHAHVLFRFVSITNTGTISGMAIDQLQIKSTKSFYIGGFDPAYAKEKGIVDIIGEGFSESGSGNTVMFNGVTATVIDASATKLVVLVPPGASTGKVTVKTHAQTISLANFTVIPVLEISGFTPALGKAGTEVTISGTGFDNVAVNNVVAFHGALATVTQTTATYLKVIVPAGATTGKITVEANRQGRASTTGFTVISAPLIKIFTPDSGIPGTEVVMSGTGFSPIASNNVVKFNGVAATVTWAAATSLRFTVPAGATTGKITIEANGQTTTSTSNFTVIPAPSITDFAPLSGIAGSEVLINGTGFATGTSNNVVKFAGVAAKVTEATATYLKVVVPEGAATGKITIEANGQTMAGFGDFTITSALFVTGFNPLSGVEGTEVTIAGVGFAVRTTDNVVKFSGITATVTEVAPTYLKAIVPANATTGKVTIEAHGQSIISFVSFIVSPILGTSQNLGQPSFVSYPNPLTNVLNIRLSGGAGTPVTVHLYNLHGQLITKVHKQSVNDVLQIPVGNLASGVYTIKITIAEATTTYKVMKL